MNVIFKSCHAYAKGKNNIDVIRVDNTADATQKFSGRITLDVISGGNNTPIVNGLSVEYKYPTLLNSLTNFNTASYPELRYYKDRTGTVFLEGMIKGGTGNIDVGYLDAGYRPKRTTPPVPINTNDVNGDAVAYLTVYNDGRIRVIGMKSAFTAINTSFFAEQ
jgi:hypothetical protein